MLTNVSYLQFRSKAKAELSDEALIDACAGGDKAALGELFDRYYRQVYRFISRMSGCDIRDLDDLVQSSFLEVQRSARRFRQASAVKTWIFAIAANVVRHHIRSEARRKKALDHVAALPASVQSSPYDDFERKDQLQQLVVALRNLPHGQRVVFVMCDLEGISGVEVARTLHLRQGTVWRRLHEARKTLAAAIERRQAR